MRKRHMGTPMSQAEVSSRFSGKKSPDSLVPCTTLHPYSIKNLEDWEEQRVASGALSSRLLHREMLRDGVKALQLASDDFEWVPSLMELQPLVVELLLELSC